MWILVVLSTVQGMDEVKLSHYDMYESRQTCYLAANKLDKQFEDGEKSVCMYSPPLSPKPKK